jgi:hypothetical protein
MKRLATLRGGIMPHIPRHAREALWKGSVQ